MVRDTTTGVKRVGFIPKPGSQDAALLAAELSPKVRELGAELVVIAGDERGNGTVSESEFANAVDLAVALGGDGTMLRASRILGDSGVPVIGINLGHLGFLAPFEAAAATDAISSALRGELPETSRMRLRVTLESAGGQAQSWVALNDAVIHQGALARLLELNAYLDEDFIASYRADGLIIATPTGSTAYNLAAGGPLLLPEQQAMALTPICAHALTMRPLVVPHDSSVTVVLGSASSEASVTVDGYWSENLAAGDRLSITRADAPLTVLGLPDKGYFDILRKKLHWGARDHDDDPARL